MRRLLNITHLLLLVLISGAIPVSAQMDPVRKDVYETPQIIVTATRTERPAIEVPYAVEVLDSRTIVEEKQSRTVPEALKEIPGVMVQKTAHGQGSPYIRGFTGYRTVMLIDGIRLNNSVFRDGPNQYWNTVDPFGVQRLELVKGTSSVLYGSDAIGGTVNVITRRPEFGGNWYNAGLVYRYASAEDSNVGRAQFDVKPTESLGFVGGISYKDFGDIRAAGIGIQPRTGYDEIDGDIKAEYRLDEGRSVVVAHQRVKQDDIWRTHLTSYARSWEGTDVGTDRKYATDQERNLTYVQYHDRATGGVLDSVDLSLSFQQQKEDQDRIRSNGRQELQGLDCKTTGAAGQVSRSFGPMGVVTCGVEYYRDDVDSYKRTYTAAGVLQSEDIQGAVADDARYDLAGIYLQDEIFFGDRISVLAGGRYTYAKAEAAKVKDPVTGSQISLSKSWDNVVGNLRGQFFVVPQEWSLYAGVGQGFRAPNFSDLTSFQAASQGYIETPSTEVGPEKYVTYETGIKGQTDRFTAQLDYFYTDMTDLIVRYPTGATVNGYRELQKANAGNGYIYGYEIYLNVRVIPTVQCYGMLTWMKGRLDQPQLDSFGNLVFIEDYVSKLQPLTTILGLRYDHPSNRFWMESLATFAAKQDELALTDRTDTGRIPPGGNPGYTVVTVRGGVKVCSHFQATVAVENILDEEYRVLGSGQNEPGINFIATLDGWF